MRIELSYLLKAGFVRKGSQIFGSLKWNNGSTISFESNLTGQNSYIRLYYENKSINTGEVTYHDYKIQITRIPSNLGIGKVLFLVCPVSGKRARILYKCYGSKIFKSRKAYSHRIYYDCQTASKTDYHNTRYWKIEKRLESLYQTTTKSHYRGKETRKQKRIRELETCKSHHDENRFRILKNYMNKITKKGHQN